MNTHESKRLNTLERDKAFLPFFQEHGMKPQAQLAEMLGWGRKQIHNFFLRHPEIPRNHQRGGLGERNGSWNGGQTTDADGYILIRAVDHPHANSGGYVREHRLVMEKEIGRYLIPQEVVHHRNEVTSDNRIENLELLPDNSQNLRYAWLGKHHSQETKEKMSQSALQVWNQRKDGEGSGILEASKTDGQESPIPNDRPQSLPGTNQLSLF